MKPTAMKCHFQRALLHPKPHNYLTTSSKQLYILRTNSTSAKKPLAAAKKPSNASTSAFRTQPGPPLLPPEEQREFDELVRKAQAPLSTSPKTHTTGATDPTSSSVTSGTTKGADAGVEVLERHPDARKPVTPEFIGDVNPKTGERGGPKREPVKFGDWSYGGKVTDF